jgi:hypothetical protein
MMQDYLKDRKRDIWPEIKDWTDPQNQWRKEKDFDKLTWSQWFFFHPTAYQLTTYGGNIIMMICFAIATLFSFVKGWMFPAGISFIFFGFMVWNFIKLMKAWEFNKHITYYDLWMREEPTLGRKQE